MLVDSERHWPLLDEVYFTTLIGEKGWESWKPQWLEMRKEHRPLDDMFQLLRNWFGVTTPVAELKADRERTMFTIYRTYNLQPLPGAEKLLDLAQMLGVPVAIASGMNRPIIEFVIKFMGWENDVRAFASTHEGAKRNKPHPDVFLLAAERIGVDPDRCLVFENDWKGYQAAQAAGMRCYLVRDHYFPERAAESVAECAKIGVPTFESLEEVIVDMGLHFLF